MLAIATLLSSQKSGFEVSVPSCAVRPSCAFEDGEIEIVRRNPVTNAVEVAYTSGQRRQIKTVRHRAAHDAGLL